ncbi:transposase [Streptomyces sp. NPDC048560]|uniref:transposase n=1 Tax=Streptomyces sp. NPDC048560 TaxID=3155488 RepID=UPI003413AF66
MTDREWAQVRAALPVPGWLAARGGQPESYCHRQMIDAIRFLVHNGIKWRAMPVAFPPGTGSTGSSRRWRDNGLVKELHDRLRGKTRGAAGARSHPQASSTPSRSRQPRPCPPPHAASTVGRRSTAASGTSWSTRQGCCSRSWSPRRT